MLLLLGVGIARLGSEELALVPGTLLPGTALGLTPPPYAYELEKGIALLGMAMPGLPPGITLLEILAAALGYTLPEAPTPTPALGLTTG